MKLYALITCFSIIFSVKAQTSTNLATIQWGAETKEPGTITLNDIVLSNPSGIFITKKKSKGVTGYEYNLILEHYNHNLVRTNTITVKLAGKKFSNTLELNDKLYLFYSQKEKQKKENTFFCQQVDKITLTLKDKPVKIGQIDYSESSYGSGRFLTAISKNKEYLLVFNGAPYDKKGKDRYSFSVYDKDLNLIWNKQMSLPSDPGLVQLGEFRIDNAGNVYIQEKIFDDIYENREKNAPNYRYGIISYTDKGEITNKISVLLEGKFITDIQWDINKKGELVCAGFFSNGENLEIKGSYSLIYDVGAKQPKTQSTSEFDIDFINYYMMYLPSEIPNQKRDEQKNIELCKYLLGRLIHKDGGGMLLIAEQYYKKEVGYDYSYRQNPTAGITGTAGDTRKTRYYNYNDIIVISINPSGEIEWNKKIAKKQMTRDDKGIFSSFSLGVFNENLYFLFNDHPKNVTYQPGGEISNYGNDWRSSVVVLVTLNEEGLSSRELLFSTEETEVLMQPKLCKQTNDSEIILFGQKGNKKRFAKISFLD